MAKDISGRKLEKKVADAYRQLGAKKVEHDVDLNGNQIDVYVELETPSGLLHRIAVESKDWVNPVGVDVVNDFAKIVQLLRNNQLIDGGVIIASSGFSKQARKAAQANSIELLESADLDVMVAKTHLTQSTEAEISSYIISFDSFIHDRTRGFVGREFAFEAVDGFLSNPAMLSGYFFIRSDPGVGKSAFLAQLVKKRDLPIHHFNIALQSINTPRQFMGNICARLIAQFNLSYTEFPRDFEKSGTFLNKLLYEASAKLKLDERLIIVIDALDEVGPMDVSPANPLCLPHALPDKVYFVVTARRKESLLLSVSNIVEWELGNKSEENQRDIRTFVKAQAASEGIKTWTKQRKLTQEQFIQIMLEKSEGNFMYLHHVLPAIAGGWLAGFAVADLPHGLRAYYHKHWEQMRDHDPNKFERIYQPVVCILGAAQEAVSADQVAEWTKLESRQVRQVFKEWITFLHQEISTDSEERHRIYHTAFRDFLQEEVDPGLKTYHAMIANSILNKIRTKKSELER